MTSRSSFDASDSVSYLWDLATEAVNACVTRYPQLSAEDGLEAALDWVDDPENSCHPYEVVVVSEEASDNTWSRHGFIYEMGLLAGLR